MIDDGRNASKAAAACAYTAAGGAFDGSAASIAVTKLNTCATLSSVGRHQEAERLAQEAVNLLVAEVARLAQHHSPAHHPGSAGGEAALETARGSPDPGGKDTAEREDGGDAAEDAGDAADDGDKKGKRDKNKGTNEPFGPEPGQEEGSLLAIAFHNLGAEREHLGRFAEAGVAYRQGFETACKALGPGSQFARTLHGASTRALAKVGRHPDYRCHRSFGRTAATSWPVAPARPRSSPVSRGGFRGGSQTERLKDSAARSLRSPLLHACDRHPRQQRMQEATAGRISPSLTPHPAIMARGCA